MTGAGAAIRRVVENRMSRGLDAARAAALVELAAKVRELTETVVLTDVPADEIAAVTRELDVLHRRLAAVRRSEPPFAIVDEAGFIRQSASPVIGELNPIAPPIRMTTTEDGTAYTEFTLSPVYEGPPGFVHGGVSAMILDHLAGMAASANGTPGMTAGLDLRYRRPTPHSVPLSAEAKTVRMDGRKTFVDARIIGPDGRTTVEASGVFIMPPMD